MKVYHLYFYILKILILILFSLMLLKIIPVKGKFFIIIDTLFKFSLGLFIIIFFTTKKLDIDKHDRIIIIISGFILLLLIDYMHLVNILFNKNYKDYRIEYNNSEET
jgi:hypothetical protein